MNFKTSKNLELKLEMVSQEREMNNMITTHIIDVANRHYIPSKEEIEKGKEFAVEMSELSEEECFQDIITYFFQRYYFSNCWQRRRI